MDDEIIGWEYVQCTIEVGKSRDNALLFLTVNGKVGFELASVTEWVEDYGTAGTLRWAHYILKKPYRIKYE